MPHHLYFAYGSNLNDRDLRYRCPHARPVAPARLEGWRLVFRRVADIEPAAGRVVPGALWKLSDRDLANLDRYEGVPSHYVRRSVVADTAAGATSPITYVMARSDPKLPPPGSYLRCIEEGYRHWALPLDELERAVQEAHASERFQPAKLGGVDLGSGPGQVS